MTTPYTTGSITLTNGSAVVTGVGTAWQTALIAGGTIYVEADGNPLPILTVDTNTKITAAIKWKGASGTYPYAIMRDTAYGQQTVANAQALSTYLQRLDNASLAALASLVPAADRMPFFTGNAEAALTTLTAFARTLLDDANGAAAYATLGEIPNGQLPARLRGAPAAVVADANDAVTFGNYSVSGATLNIPEGAQGTLSVGAINSNFVSQIYTRTSNGSTYLRWNNNGTWSPWAKVALQDRGNIWAGSQSLDSGGGYVNFNLIRSTVSGLFEAGTNFIGLGSSSDHPLVFRVNATERARFEPTNGDFLVGLTATIDPATGNTTGVAMRPATGRMWRRQSGYNPFFQSRLSTDGVVQDFYRETTSVGNISVSTTGTTYSTTSDWRRKSDVQPIVTFSLAPEQFDVLDNAELKIMALRPVFHRWNDAPEKGVVTGFLAHEAQQVVPHAVTGKKDEIVDVGREIIPAHEAEIEIVDEDGNTQTVTITVPEVVNEGVRRDALAEGAEFEKTGEVPVFQTMDYGLITADIVAALQCVIHKNMLQGEQIETLTAKTAELLARIEALEGAGQPA
ncbi:pyocin knob domain-containing S74 family peptidase [Ensifer adhaerens]|uniref:Pyocin knob domain-containing S74 family peptidase n=1 Tax=Ensifer adhaerens TaxID=106592 RepID=A0A9Q8Y9Z8_ENSAD|nr:pyocin knob domain-containing S74 family peptidase [Ensifer adhaerens]USJ24736.1 pyocin knob domain-containing S74 family peptidase [Ensifer adhaerens]